MTITYEEYANLLQDQRWRLCVESAGVDNWEGYDYAMKEFYGDEEW